ncbi:hypothetical protein ACFV2H_42870 [Streptomyces sp. NPDC059629]|uniref:hypothetical protein n=1 Tax=Streptomyces sp. NPDC059629 TaxID=3346889 RepID=UPI00367A5BAE
MNSEEYEVECPQCTAGLFVAFGRYGTFVSAGDHVTGPGADAATAGRGELTPARPDRLAGVGARLYGEAVRAGQPAVAEALTHAFGQGRRPSCDTAFSVAGLVAEQWV